MFKIAADRTLVESATVNLNADLHHVFKFVATDFCENYPKWTPDIVTLKRVSEGPLAVGSRIRVVRREGGEIVENELKVTEIVTDRRFSLESLTDPFEMTYQFEACESPPMTILTFTFQLKKIEMVMRPFTKLIRAALRDGAKRSVENVRNLVCA